MISHTFNRSRPGFKSFISACTAVALFAICQGSAFSPALPNALAGSLSGSLFPVAYLSPLLAQQTGEKTAQVIAKYSRVRSQPSDNAQIILLAKQGQRFPVISSTSAWCQISLDNNNSGWIVITDITIEGGGQTSQSAQSRTPASGTSQPQIDRTLLVKAKYARVRSAPDDGSAFVFLVRQGDRFDILEKRGLWARIQLDNRIGWVNVNDAAGISTAPETQQPSVRAAVPPVGQQVPVAGAVPVDTPASSRQAAAPTRAETTATPIVSEREAAATQPSRQASQAEQPDPSLRRTFTELPRRAISMFNKPERRDQTTATETVPTMPEMEIRPALPLTIPAVEPVGSVASGKKLFAIVVSSHQVPVRQELSPESPIILFANRGHRFPLVQTGESWCKVLVNGREGWIERRFVEISETERLAVRWGDYVFFGVIIMVVVALFFAIRSTIRRFDKLKSRWFRTNSVEKTVLIIAHKDKIIQRYLTNKTSPLSHCFTELGLKVSMAHDLKKVHTVITHTLPDVIIADWEMEKDLQGTMEKMVASRKVHTGVGLVIFYNVYDPVSVTHSRILPDVRYLGPNFTDRELFSMVTPLIMKSTTNRNIRKSVETSALEGEIGENSLSEVFQFVEIGKKTGCLLIEHKKPIGIIYFKQGTIVYASTRTTRGQDAIFEILGSTEGHFYFVVDKVAPEENCMIQTLGILMEWTRRLDEKTGH